MTSASNSASAGLAPVYWLAVGTFAVGTEGFMIAAILPRIVTNCPAAWMLTARSAAILGRMAAIMKPSVPTANVPTASQ